MTSAIQELKDSLHPKLRAVLEKREFDEFSEIQMRAVPKLITGINAILIAPTRTGKTESAMLPVFHHMLTDPIPKDFRLSTSRRFGPSTGT